MTTRPAKLPFLLCSALVAIGCQEPRQEADANGSQAIEAGVTTVHASVADTVACADSAAYTELRQRLEQRMPADLRQQVEGDSMPTTREDTTPAVHRVEIRLDRAQETLAVSQPHLAVHPGDRIEWTSDHDWAVLFMKAPSSPLADERRIVEVARREDAPRGAMIRRESEAACGIFDYTIIVEDGGKMYSLDPEVWVLRRR